MGLGVLYFISPLSLDNTAHSMTRQKPADKKQKPGRKSNFSTCKENIICDNFGETYLAAHATSKPEVGLFLNKVANWAIHRWGYSKSLHVDTDGEDDDPTEVFSLDVDLPDDDISEEEATERTAYYDDIRNVSHSMYSYVTLTHHIHRNWERCFAENSFTRQLLPVTCSHQRAPQSWPSWRRKYQRNRLEATILINI